MRSYFIYWVLRKLGLDSVFFHDKQKDTHRDDPEYVPCPYCNYDCRVVTENGRCPECDWLVNGRSEIVKANDKSTVQWWFWAFCVVLLFIGFTGMLASKRATMNPWPVLGLMLSQACILAKTPLLLLGSFKHIIIDEDRIQFAYRFRDDVMIYWDELATFQRKGRRGGVLLFVMNDGRERKWKMRKDLASRIDILIRQVRPALVTQD